MNFASGLFVALAALTLPLPSASEVGDQLFDNIELADGARGWRLNGGTVVEGAGPDGGRAVVLAAVEEPNRWTHFGNGVKGLPIHRELHFTVSVQSRVGAKLMINSFAYDGDSKAIETWNGRFPATSEEWIELSQTYVLPAGTEQLTMFVISSNDSEVLVAKPSLVLGGRALPKSLSGPGVLRASAISEVRAKEAGEVGHVLFPVPLPTEHQIPLTFDVRTDPASALRGFRWIPREDGVNWLCEVAVAPEGDGTRVRWESLVLVRDREDAELPHAAEPEVPEEAAPWLRSTACIQSEDKAIAAKAKELGGEDLASTVANVLAFSSTNRGVGQPFTALDAKTALGCGGSCTSRANLAAALLRAEGIPARTSAHLPTWSGPLYEHWHVEYWHPGAGWTWIEPTLGKLRPKPYSMVVLNIANPEDEDAGFDPAISHSGVMTGVPRYAVHENSEELWLAKPGWSDDLGLMNEARTVGVIDAKASDAVFESAERAWETLLESCRAGELDSERTARIEAALLAEETTRAIAKALKSK